MRMASAARSLVALLTTATISLLGLTLSAGTANADDSVGIAIAPSNAQGKAEGRSRFTYKVDPGQTVKDHVRVRNAGTETLRVTLFAADAYNDEKGDFALRGSDEKATGAASWTTFDGKPQLRLTLARGESRVVPFTVTVPKDATPGDHPAGILAAATSSGQIKVERRIADRMYVRVSGDLQPILTVASMSAVYQGGWNPFDGSVLVNASLSNAGNVALEGVVTLTGGTWFGLGVGQLVRQDLPEVLPGNTAPVSFELTGVPAMGYLIASLLLQSGISGDAPDPGPLPVIHRDAFVLAVPWLFVALLVVAAAAFFFIRWRKQAEERRAAEWDAYNQAEAALRDAAEASERIQAAGDANRGAQ